MSKVLVKQTLQGHSDKVNSVAYSPDGKTLASGSDDRTIKLWDIQGGECLQTFRGHRDWVNSVVYSPDGKTLASGSINKTIKLWDIQSGKCLQTFRGHRNWVNSIAYSPDGKTLTFSKKSQDNTVPVLAKSTSIRPTPKKPTGEQSYFKWTVDDRKGLAESFDEAFAKMPALLTNLDHEKNSPA